MNLKLTEWFPPEIKPVHIGVYQCNPFAPHTYRNWDGKNWGVSQHTAEQASFVGYLHAQYQDKIEWRGLAEEPVTA
jgi:hypothetical protein